MSTGSPGPSLGDVIAAAAFFLGLIVAWLYVAGWSYAYHYFDYFRVPLLLADISREHIFVYGGLCIWKNLPVATLVTAVLFAAIVASIRFRVMLGRSVLVTLLTTIVIFLFVMARVAGTDTAAADASQQRQTDYDAYPRVVVDLIEEREDQPLSDRLAGPCGKLILASNERVFLIFPKATAPALELNTIVVPWRDIRTLTLSSQYSSCP